MPLHAEGLYLTASGKLQRAHPLLASLGMWMPAGYRRSLLQSCKPSGPEVISEPLLLDPLTLLRLSEYEAFLRVTQDKPEGEIGFLRARALSMLGRKSPKRSTPNTREWTLANHVMRCADAAERFKAGAFAEGEAELKRELELLQSASREEVPSWVFEIAELRLKSLAGSSAARKGNAEQAVKIWRRCIDEAVRHESSDECERWVFRDFARRRIEHLVRLVADRELPTRVGRLGQLACRLDPYDARAWLLRGTLWARNNDLDSAANCYQRAAQLDPIVSAVARRKLALVRGLQGKRVQAVIELRRSLETEPSTPLSANERTFLNCAPPAISTWATAQSDRAGWVFHTFRPFFDLGPRSEGPLLTHAPELAVQKWEARLIGVPSMQRTMPPAFRQTLHEQAGRASADIGLLPQIEGVATAPPSSSWAKLCADVGRFRQLEPEELLLLSQVLISLAMYEGVMCLLAEYAECKLSPSATEANLSYAFAFSEYMVFLGNPERYTPRRLEQIATRAPRGSRAAFAAHLKLLVHSGKANQAQDSVRSYVHSARQSLDALQGVMDSFSSTLWESRFWRAASFLPYIEADYHETFRQLGLAREFGERAVARDDRESIVRTENLVPILESTGKVAIQCGDNRFALRLARERVAIDTNDSVGYIELGNALFRLHRWEEAGEAYSLGACLGPPGTEIAWYLAGESFERAGRTTEAVDTYLASLGVDPGGVSPKSGLRRLTRRPEIRGALA